MPQTANERKILRDWHTAEQRMAGHRDSGWPTLIQLAQGVICIGLVLLMLWFLWQMTTPAGIAEMANVAAYVKHLITGD